MAHGTPTHQDLNVLHEHVTPVRTYVLVCVALLVLTVLTYYASFLDLGPANIVLALFIAVSKAALIALFFMHVRYSSGLTRLTAFAGLLWLGILIVGTLDDFVTRGWVPLSGH